MLGRTIKHGATDQSAVIRIVDSVTGIPETGVVYNTTGIALWYRRELAAQVAITEATLAALTTAHADGGFLHIGDGYYRLDLPDAACASGVAGVMVGGTVTDMIVIGTYHPLAAFVLDDGATAASVADAVWDEATSGHTTSGTTGERLTRIPNVAAGANGGLPTVNASNYIAGVQGTINTLDALDTAQDTQHSTTQGRLPAALVSGRIDASVGAMANNVMTAAPAASDLTTELQSGLATAAALDAVDNFLDTEVAAIITTLGTPAGASVAADIAAVKAQTAAIETDTAEIGAAGAGLTNINLPNQTMDIVGNITGNLSGTIGGLATAAKAEVQAEAKAALIDMGAIE